MSKSTKWRGAVIILAICFISAAVFYWTGTNGNHVNYSAKALDLSILEAEDRGAKKSTYEGYLQRFEGAARPSAEIVGEGRDAFNDSGQPIFYEDFEGMPGVSVYSPEEGALTWEIDVPQAGLYQIQVDYYPIQGKGMAIERELRINGELPFDGVKFLTFSRVWADDTAIQSDANGNERRPSQVEKPRWNKIYLQDHMGYYHEPYLFFFEKGKNSIELTSVQDMMLIRKITLKQAEPIPDYNELLKAYKAKGYQEVNLAAPVKIQAEAAATKSDAMLYPTYDRSTPATEPSHPSKIRLNTIGGESWRNVGQWISWKIDAPESGLYEIGLKYWQNSKSGRYVSRKLLIDGEVPFKEMNHLKFPYDGNWQVEKLGGEKPYLFYLEKGEHEITLEVSLGDLANVIRIVDNSVYQLNAAYRELLMIIGSTPDVFRDYQLDLKVPGALKIMKDQSEVLKAISDRLAADSGKRGISTSTLDILAIQLESMAHSPETIPERWSAFKNNLSSLGAWVLGMQEQPLQLDYLFLTSASLEKPRANSSFVENTVYAVKSFIASFTEDYNSVGSRSDQAVTVWVTSRDYGNILNALVENDFHVNSDIEVNVEIVNEGTLLPATLAGVGPDIALQIGIGDPVNYAVRNAVVPLSRFDDFADVAERFSPSALVPYQFNDEVYGLPETQTFPMLFYRKDIFEELGIELPETWGDLYKIMPLIQKQNMNIGIPINGVGGTGSVAGLESTLSTLAMFLYQNGGSLYTESGDASYLDQEEAIRAFLEWTSLFVDYSIPIQYDFANRFRTGEMPIGIADYSTYNYLSVFAPELKGLWEMAPVPGMQRDQREIVRYVGSSGSASIILKNSKKQAEAWEFLKWWTSADVQSRFGNELESVIGVAARYATANLEAAELLGWPTKDYRSLMEQWRWVKGNPEVPGGYFTPRHIENAFRKVLNELEDPRETLLDYTQIINLEITNKRKEFGLEPNIDYWREPD